MLYAPVPLAFARLKVLLCYIALPCRSITHYGFMRPLFAALRCGRKNPSFRDFASLGTALRSSFLVTADTICSCVPIRSATLSRRSVSLSLRSLAPKRRDNSAPNVLIIASCRLPLAFAPCPLPGTASVPEANHAKVLTIIYVGFYYASYPRA